jgi:hypothetical protein
MKVYSFPIRPMQSSATGMSHTLIGQLPPKTTPNQMENTGWKKTMGEKRR